MLVQLTRIFMKFFCRCSTTSTLTTFHQVIGSWPRSQILLSIKKIRNGKLTWCNIYTFYTKFFDSKFYFHYSLFNARVTRPLCLVELHMLDSAARRECSLFTSLTFCKSIGRCALRSNEIIHLYPSNLCFIY